MSRRPFFYRETHGIRITVRPTYLPEQSRPHARHYVFAYYVRIENVGKLPAQLLTRRWRIHDSIGEDSQVEGEGVIGEQPLIAPGRRLSLRAQRRLVVRCTDSAVRARRHRGIRIRVRVTSLPRFARSIWAR